MTLEEILKADGWSDTDLAALAPMLADQRFRASMEKQYGAVATERDSLKERDAAWERQLNEQWQPRVTASEKAEHDALLKVAELEARLKFAKEKGYLTTEEETRANADIEAARNSPAFDPKNYVSMQDAQRMLEAEGQAIAMMADVNNEYAYLHNGKTLYEYETEIDSRRIRGMEALRQEAKAKRMNLNQYVAQKFDFQGKRDALAVKRQQEHDDAIRKEQDEKTRNELASTYGNPNMRMAVPSRFATIIPKPANGKQPWEIPPAERKSARLERAMKAQMTGAPN
jgi:hypothetical protein